MAWLLFLDESGHDHKQMPYEVRGGIALQDSQLWPFVLTMQQLERECFGGQLHQYKKEIKGCSLLDRKRFKFANQAATMAPEVRRKHARAFLSKGLERKTPTRDEFTAYGQACLEMARRIFQKLSDHQAVMFASAIPRSVHKPDEPHIEDFLRKDHVFVQERYFYFLEGKRQHGLLVMDEVEKAADRKFVRQLQNYFTRTQTGHGRTAWIVPTPFFVSSATANETAKSSNLGGSSSFKTLMLREGGESVQRKRKEATHLEPPTRSRSAAEPPRKVLVSAREKSSGGTNCGKCRIP